MEVRCSKVIWSTRDDLQCDEWRVRMLFSVCFSTMKNDRKWVSFIPSNIMKEHLGSVLINWIYMWNFRKKGKWSCELATQQHFELPRSSFCFCIFFGVLSYMETWIKSVAYQRSSDSLVSSLIPLNPCVCIVALWNIFQWPPSAQIILGFAALKWLNHAHTVVPCWQVFLCCRRRNVDILAIKFGKALWPANTERGNSKVYTTYSISLEWLSCISSCTIYHVDCAITLPVFSWEWWPVKFYFIKKPGVVLYRKEWLGPWHHSSFRTPALFFAIHCSNGSSAWPDCLYDSIVVKCSENAVNRLVHVPRTSLFTAPSTCSPD